MPLALTEKELAGSTQITTAIGRYFAGGELDLTRIDPAYLFNKKIMEIDPANLINEKIMTLEPGAPTCMQREPQTSGASTSGRLAAPRNRPRDAERAAPRQWQLYAAAQAENAGHSTPSQVVAKWFNGISRLWDPVEDVIVLAALAVNCKEWTPMEQTFHEHAMNDKRLRRDKAGIRARAARLMKRAQRARFQGTNQGLFCTHMQHRKGDPNEKGMLAIELLTSQKPYKELVGGVTKAELLEMIRGLDLRDSAKSHVELCQALFEYNIATALVALPVTHAPNCEGATMALF